MFSYIFNREREKKGGRQRDRDRNRDREGDTETETERQTDRQTDRQRTFERAELRRKYCIVSALPRLIYRLCTAQAGSMLLCV